MLSKTIYQEKRKTALLIQCGFLVLGKIIKMKKIVLLMLFLSVFSFSQTLEQAKEMLRNDMQSTEAKKMLKDLSTNGNAEASFILAKIYFNKEMSNASRRYIDRAIDKEPDNVDFREFRTYLITIDDIDEMKIGVEDLEFLINNGEDTQENKDALNYLKTELKQRLNPKSQE